ncbi:MAG: hypothetical protein IPK52_27415 [Chloroflexi bacterium]|nr:hypothetical protein [Chloroflexota bacterium]
MNKSKHAAPRIEYVAPPIEMVEDFSGQVCLEMAARSGDARFTQAETVKGFAAFLHTLLTIEARRRNREASIDMPDETAVQSSLTQTAECSSTPPS